MQRPEIDLKNNVIAFVCFCLFLCCTFSVAAQEGKLRKADTYLERFQYEAAIELYEKVLRKEENAHALRQIGRIYRKQHRYDDAAAIFARLTQLPEAVSLDFLWHGMSLLHGDRCEAAQLVFHQYLLRKPYDEHRSVLEDVCQAYHDLQAGQQERYRIDRPKFNGPDSDLAPAYYGEQLVFGSVRRDEAKSTPYYDLYLVDLPDAATLPGTTPTYGPVYLFPQKSVTGGNEAILTFDRHLTELYLTRNRQSPGDAGIRRLEIAQSRRNADGSWGELLPLSINNDTYSVAHPALSEDGQRLFFSSDMPGGFGGKDLYVCHRLEGAWGPPINMGPMVNTTGDELYPYYHEAGELYFASDGHFGLGGQDLFRSEDLGLGNWSRPANLGAPINSAYDDFALILAPDGNSGFFTSNRGGAATQDDIYRFVPRKVRLELTFADLGPEYLPLKFYHNDLPVSTDITGRYTAYLDWNECGRLRVMQKQFAALTHDYCVREQKSDTLALALTLTPLDIAPLAATEPFSVVGRLLDPYKSQPIEGAGAELLSINDEKVIAKVETAADGNYRLQLRAAGCYQLRFTHPDYFSKIVEYSICTQQNGATLQIEDFYLQPLGAKEDAPDTPLSDVPTFTGYESRQDKTGKRVYRLAVHYDLGRASVRPEAIGELQKLLRLLKDNPSVMVEISSHTDAQGKASYNRQLSQRRATAIRNYLVKYGISDTRIEAKGYGESDPLNHCVDGVRCSEAEHQVNRRTEFRVIGKVGDSVGS